LFFGINSKKILIERRALWGFLKGLVLKRSIHLKREFWYSSFYFF
jgi:hypothetical protein